MESPDKPRIVNASDCEGPAMSLLQLIGLPPSWTVRCGFCDNTFIKRIPMIDLPTVPCPLCKTLNRIQVVLE